MLPSNQEILCQVLMYCIHAVPKLGNLFLKWSCLTREEKFIVGKRMFAILHSEAKMLFLALYDAFTRWELIQDTQGAPGFHEDFKPDNCDESIERKISDISSGFDLFISTVIDDKRFQGYQSCRKKRTAPPESLPRSRSAAQLSLPSDRQRFAPDDDCRNSSSGFKSE